MDYLGKQITVTYERKYHDSDLKLDKTHHIKALCTIVEVVNGYAVYKVDQILDEHDCPKWAVEGDFESGRFILTPNLRPSWISFVN